MWKIFLGNVFFSDFSKFLDCANNTYVKCIGNWQLHFEEKKYFTNWRLSCARRLYDNHQLILCIAQAWVRKMRACTDILLLLHIWPKLDKHLLACHVYKQKKSLNSLQVFCMVILVVEFQTTKQQNKVDF